MKKTRILSLLVAAAMFCTLFTGCVGGKTVMKVGGNAISENIYNGAVVYSDIIFQQSYGFSMADMLDQQLAEGKTGADMLKTDADRLLKEFEAIRSFAKEKGIELTAEEKKAIDDYKQSQIDAAGGRKAFLDGLKADKMNEEFFDYLTEWQQIYSKLYTELFTGEGEFAPSTEDVVASLGGYARVKHVLIQAEEGSEEYEAKKAEAQKIADRAKAGEDFEALIAEVAESGDGDPGMQSNPEGYVIDANGAMFDGSSQMITEFTTASHALAVNGVSDVVPSPYGFHIIKRYPFDAAYITENIDTYSYPAGMTAFGEQLTAYTENIEIEYTDAYDKVDVHEILGVEKTNGAAAGVGDVEEHSADDGHNHGTEAETEGDAEAEGGIEGGEAVPAQ